MIQQGWYINTRSSRKTAHFIELKTIFSRNRERNLRAICGVRFQVIGSPVDVGQVRNPCIRCKKEFAEFIPTKQIVEDPLPEPAVPEAAISRSTRLKNAAIMCFAVAVIASVIWVLAGTGKF